MNSSFMNTVKENIRVVNLLLFAISAICLILPIYSFGYYGYGFSYSAFSLLGVSFWAVFLFVAPIFGLVYLFALSKGKTRKQHALYLGIAHVVGIVVILWWRGFAFGAILSLLAYAAGAAANGIVFFNK